MSTTTINYFIYVASILLITIFCVQLLFVYLQHFKMIMFPFTCLTGTIFIIINHM